ncbi:NAD(P)-dependent dehydrogenase (short-subunit alcohol dehydrogenase family) [Novosphingobium kunmingense]|uniref:NAD(P)-dependent dehydrogenase (Short-subunit alcohol dehydrogenase family) n=1 Tax=Novosphingobium kunmingense TaxID=1211806 RepID=A0A2N0HJI2_9SPHN|nr:SDR family NAD(P)-dependent oxidoreductase [Novosphingobium kunmingense]PKB19103.1 NAD(P)-dependent dehydrogenase (short-subunit alcohol dehydrogenase family) [Novosphingobium kunmingense]
MRFADKCVIVTGAASGIGRATALLFAAEGARVYAADRDFEGAQRLSGESPGITAVACDVCDVAQIKALMDRAAQDCGGIDVVFNNAGAAGDRAPIDEIEAEGWDRTMDLLLRSVAMGIRYAVPHMKGRKGASIVNTSSIAAIGPGYSPTAYAVAKAGVLHLTKCTATELAKYGIRVNAVQPGFINTNIFTTALEMPADLVDTAKAMILQASSNAQPVARGGMPDDIAQAVAFLASDAAGFMTGASLVVDGGITIGPRHAWDPETPDMFSALQAMADAAAAAGTPA